MVYYYNPFNETFYLEELDKSIEVFPDTLKNAHEYPLKVLDLVKINYNTWKIRRRNKKIEIHLSNGYFFDFTAELLNLKIVKIEYNHTVSLNYYMNNQNIDLNPNPMVPENGFSASFIPTDTPSVRMVAIVPIIRNPRMNVPLKTFYLIIMILEVILAFLYSLKFIRSRDESLKVSDAIWLLLTHSINYRLKRLSRKIIFMTFMLAMLKMMNEFYSDMVLFRFEHDEVPFETYADLNNSQLKHYYIDNLYLLQSLKFEDQHLSSIIKRTQYLYYMDQCAMGFMVRKDQMCITNEPNAKFYIYAYRSQNGSASMKIAEPAIYKYSSSFYQFAQNSPYADKFLKMIRRIKETTLWQVRALIDKNPKIINIVDEPQTVIDNDEIMAGQMWAISGFGFLLSIMIFFLEMIKSVVCKKFTRFLNQVR